MRLRHTLERPALLGLVAVLAAVAAAVQANAGSGATSPPLKLMVIAPVQTPIQNYPDAFAGAQAAADAINKKGGIKGRRIQILTCNTQSNANVAVACAREAVSEGVAAVVGHISTLSTLEIPILRIDPRYEREQIERVRKVRAARDAARFASATDGLRAAIRAEENLMEPVLECVRAYATVGEMVTLMKEEYGTWREPEIF